MGSWVPPSTVKTPWAVHSQCLNEHSVPVTPRLDILCPNTIMKKSVCSISKFSLPLYCSLSAFSFQCCSVRPCLNIHFIWSSEQKNEDFFSFGFVVLKKQYKILIVILNMACSLSAHLFFPLPDTAVTLEPHVAWAQKNQWASLLADEGQV